MTAIVSVRTGLRLVTKDSDAKPTPSIFLCFSWVSLLVRLDAPVTGSMSL